MHQVVSSSIRWGDLEIFLFRCRQDQVTPLLWELGRLPIFVHALEASLSYLRPLILPPLASPIPPLSRDVLGDYRRSLLSRSISLSLRATLKPKPPRFYTKSWSSQFASTLSRIDTSLEAGLGCPSLQSAQGWDMVEEAVRRYGLSYLDSYITGHTGGVHRHFASLRYSTLAVADSYLSYLSPRASSPILRLRLSVLRLDRQERRYGCVSQPASPCRCCTLAQPEDEEHFLLHCPAYASLRASRLVAFGPSVDYSLQQVLRPSSKEASQQLSGFVYEALKVRKKQLKSRGGEQQLSVSSIGPST